MKKLSQPPGFKILKHIMNFVEAKNLVSVYGIENIAVYRISHIETSFS